MDTFHIERPQILGGFSLDKERKYDHSLKGMKYLAIQKEQLPMDLNIGYDQFEPCHQYEGLKFVFKFIEQEFKRLYDDEKKKLPFHFVSRRGVFAKIICTLYSEDPWIILATKFRGTTYLQRVKTEEENQYKENRSDYVKKCEFYGKKFEALAMSDLPGESPQTNQSGAVHEAGDLNLALTTKYGEFKLFYCAETHCVEGSTEGKQLNDFKFLELKTNHVQQFKKSNKTFQKKLLKWWCQSYLGGIESIYCGLRTDEGKVHSIEHLNVSGIPQKCQREWSVPKMLTFGLNFLKEVDKQMAEIDCPYTVFRFSYNLKSTRNLTVKEFISDKRTEHSFLPEEYISLFRYNLVRGIERIELNCQN